MLYLQAIYYHSLLAYKSAQLYIDIVDVIVSMFSSWSSYDHAFDRKSDACNYFMIDICAIDLRRFDEYHYICIDAILFIPDIWFVC
jgi:hypothetical protein